MNQALEAGNDRRYNRYARRTLGASLLGLIVIVVLSPAMPPEFLPPPGAPIGRWCSRP